MPQLYRFDSSPVVYERPAAPARSVHGLLCINTAMNIRSVSLALK